MTLQEAVAEQQAKQVAYDRDMRRNQTCPTPVDTRGGMAGCDTPSGRDSLLGRLHARNRHAQQEARQHEMRGELIYLLEKNPEFARILDLYEQVGR